MRNRTAWLAAALLVGAGIAMLIMLQRSHQTVRVTSNTGIEGAVAGSPTSDLSTPPLWMAPRIARWAASGTVGITRAGHSSDFASPTPHPTDEPVAHYPPPNEPTIAPNPTWVAASASEMAIIIASQVGDSPLIHETVGPYKVLAAADVFPEDADELMLGPTVLSDGLTPDVAVVIEGHFTQNAPSWIEALRTTPGSGVTIPTPTPTHYRYMLILVDRQYGMMGQTFANDLDALMRRLPEQ